LIDFELAVYRTIPQHGTTIDSKLALRNLQYG
jgi:hypothetical protein